MTDSNAKAAGPVYRDEAADLMAAAARGAMRAPPPQLELEARPLAPTVRAESKRPLPYIEPVGINDNAGTPSPAPRPQRPRLSVLQIAARIVVAPWYALVAAASVGIDILFIKGLIGL